VTRRARILLATPSMGAYGGIEAFVLDLAAHLATLPDFDARVCLKLVAGGRLDASLANQVAAAGVTCAVVERASAELGRQIAWADLVHGQNASPDICVLSRLHAKRLLLTIHNHMHGRHGPRVLVWKAAAKLAQRRWYNSNFVRASWEAGPPSVRSEAFPVLPNIARQFAPVAGRRGFVFVARMIPNKGADVLAKAYAQSALDPAAWPLQMIGDGPLLPHLRGAYAHVPGLQFHGFVSGQRKAELIAAARWMVTPPNTREDMGITPFEARRRGIPCIASRDGGLPEVAGDEALLCEPGDVEDLARCLARAASMGDAEYAARAQAAYEDVEKIVRPPDWYAQSYREVLDG
jgi:glycosyltransferase involved in cell wall biosynthesis